MPFTEEEDAQAAERRKPVEEIRSQGLREDQGKDVEPHGSRDERGDDQTAWPDASRMGKLLPMRISMRVANPIEFVGGV